MAIKRSKKSKKAEPPKNDKRKGVGYRNTQQRQAVLDFLLSCNAHPTARLIHEKLKKKFRSVSLGRVYRNLRVLKEEGKVWELNFGIGVSCFSVVRHPHYHFVCNDCHNIYDINILPMKELEEKISQLTGFRTVSHRLEFFGLCDVCKLKKKDDKGGRLRAV